MARPGKEKPGKELSVAIVGRPNVGKSTLFNRLVGKRLALVDDTPGVTRDRREGKARLGALEFAAIDTAGLEESAPDSLAPAWMQEWASSSARIRSRGPATVGMMPVLAR